MSRRDDQAADEPGGNTDPHVFVEDLDHPVLRERDHHHLTRVLRVRSGDALTISDGRGAWRRCRLAGNGIDIEPIGPVRRIARPVPALTVAFALVKGQKPELVVQKLTELGLDVIVPFVAKRSVVRWDPGRVETNNERLGRVAREAAMQSRRCWLPEVASLTTYADAARSPGAARAERGGGAPTLATPTVLVGPEGGWSDEEREIDLPAVALGSHVLRAETAAIAAGVVLTGLRDGLWMAPR